MLPDTPPDIAERLLNRLRAIVAELDWSAFSPGMRVTVSAGIVTLKAAKRRTLFSRARTERSTRPKHKDATASSVPDLIIHLPRPKNNHRDP